ncbi:hypothetical protein FACS1894122_00390 [Alphaproteobacteria bacterium]|nr:hypothetical protein FACS1894122_00390 [Alphaproteobacteria bacterium]
MKKHLATLIILHSSVVNGMDIQNVLNEYHDSKKSVSSRLQEKSKALDVEREQLFKDIEKAVGENELLYSEYNLDCCQCIGLKDLLTRCTICKLTISEIEVGEAKIFKPFIDLMDTECGNDPKWKFFKNRSLSSEGIFVFSHGYGPDSDQQDVYSMEPQTVYLKDIMESNTLLLEKYSEMRNSLSLYHKQVITEIDEYFKNDRDWNFFKWRVLSSNGDNQISENDKSYRISDNVSELLKDTPELLERYTKYKKEREDYTYDSNKSYYDPAPLMPSKQDKTQHLQELESQLAPMISDEIYETSRDPEKHWEKNASRRLIALLNKNGVPINKVRFIDARTLISAMKLPAKRSDRLLRLANSSKSINRQIKKFVSKSTFRGEIPIKVSEDVFLKERIKNDLLNGAQLSRTYRNLILSLIAWSKSSPRLGDKIEYDSRKYTSRQMSFSRYSGNNCYSEYNRIKMNYDLKPEYQSCFFHQTTIESKVGLFSYAMQLIYVLFHECGHTISGELANAAAELLTADSLTMKVASNLFGKDIDWKAVRRNADILRKIPEKHVDAFIKEMYKYYPIIGGIAGQRPKNMEESIKRVAHELSGLTPEQTAKDLYKDLMEFLQVLGLMTVDDTLYINLLSDFALSAEKGLPPRSIYSSLPSKILKPENEFEKECLQLINSLEPVEMFRMNPEFFGILYQACGHNMFKYEWIIPHMSLRQALMKMVKMSNEVNALTTPGDAFF